MSENDKQRTRFVRSRPTIGLFTTNLGYGQVSQVWSGINDAVRALGVNLFCFPAGELSQQRQDGNQRAILSELASAETIDGLITFHWWPGRDEFERFYEPYRPLPVINVMRLYEGYPGVAIGNEQDMRVVMRHLIDVHGCRRIAYVRNLASNPSSEARFCAYKDVLAEHNIPLDEHLIIPCDYAHLNEVGTRTVAYLVDELGLELPTDLDAIASFSDAYSVRILEALQARGVRVPYDVAVIGFDDDIGSDRTTPPLTTMAMPRYEMGRRAVELVLAQINGERVPEETIVPGHLVVRQSCGCLPAAVTKAGYIPQARAGTGAEQPFKVVWAERRAQILSDVVEAMGDQAQHGAEATAAELLDAFAAEIEGEATATFLLKLDQVLRQAMLGSENQGAALWHSAISVMRHHFLSVVDPASLEWSQGEGLWSQARMLVEERDRLARMQQRAAEIQRAQVINDVGQALAAAPDVAAVADVAAASLPQLGIERCYLSLYENAAAPSNGARVILALEGAQRKKVDANWLRFPARRLVPEQLLPPDSLPFSLVVEPLFFQQEQIGLALFDARSEGAVFESLRSELAAALRGALLLDRARQAQHLLDDRVKELSCLNDLGRRIDQDPPLPELLTWLAQRIPPAMQHPDLCVAAIEFEGQVYGGSQALDLAAQIVQGLRVGGELVGQVHIAYREERDFLDEESALLGDIARRIVSYVARQRLADQLASEQSTLQAVFQNIPLGVFVAEAPSGKPLQANEMAQEMLGKGIVPEAESDTLAEVYEAYRYRTDELYPPAEMPLVRGMFGERTAVDDMEIRPPGHEPILLAVSGAPIYDASG
ncbi:MAG: substrate-binding domain-containing protein, partial [Anaerolineae bacterium]|nr:substrate-binding domain-containing protein [Anaerolineae bacterium]